jgi:hypothetical protein
MARQAASGRLAHHKCIVEGYPWGLDFSLVQCFDLTDRKVDLG